MAQEFDAPMHAEFRIICPDCKTIWSTTQLPSECVECRAIVTVRVIRRHSTD